MIIICLLIKYDDTCLGNNRANIRLVCNKEHSWVVCRSFYTYAKICPIKYSTTISKV